jgi:formimidoylglutamase
MRAGAKIDYPNATRPWRIMTRLHHTTAPVWPQIKPGRFAATIRADTPENCAIALLGLPDDTGVRLNGGRPGAADGPRAFREALAAFGTVWDGLRGRGLATRVFDAGDVEPVGGATETALLETHARVESVVSQLYEMGLVPVCVGGGHDLTLPGVAALSKTAGGPVGGISFDAHLDVRKRVGSGMAFRQLIEARHLDPARFVVAGVGRFVNDQEDLEWLTGQGGRIHFVDAVLASVNAPSREWMEAAIGKSTAGFVSIDLDGLDQTAGVSAQNPQGLSVRHAAALAEAAGSEPAVRYFDIMELSPRWDESGRTARVAASLFLSFVAGFAGRSG